VTLFPEPAVQLSRVLRYEVRIGRNLLIIWNRLTAHRSRLVRGVESQLRSIQLEYLPAYAPEPNPVEHMWGHLKSHEVATFCPVNFIELKHFVRRSPQWTPRIGR